MWTGNEAMVLRRLGAGMSYEQKRALCAELLRDDDAVSSGEIEVLAPMTVEQMIAMFRRASPEAKMALKSILSDCGGSCSKDIASKLREVNCYNRRLSELEENAKRANISDAIDIPTVNGDGGTETVEVPAYGIEYFLTEFSMDGAISLASGSLARVEVRVVHAGITLTTFRVSQYYKASCCTTIAEQFKKHNLRCLGSDSTFSVVVTNRNALPAETFVNGVFSYARGYPDPFAAF
jgi:hypothetical protein